MTEQTSTTHTDFRPMPYVSVTSVDGRHHLVPEATLASATDGRYLARCGSLVLAGALSAPDGRDCPLCRVSPGHGAG